MDFCICLQIGCTNSLKPEGDGQARQCPRCHNPSVIQAKDQRCLEICCIPLVPLGSSHVWHCSICSWQASQDGPAPPPAGQGYAPPQQFQGYAPNPGMQQPGGYQQQPYAPGYGGGGYGQQQGYGH
ncbi:hypothetical protein BCR35DRAFT_308830 [Leucosporidium creatinivorum]|uniref:Zinc-ribbon 15 domain-containing protein n=1 Tax=Leucosporidium creatinivorum TaxID=106004 RepID=A0A1Y2DWK7_9BASI|nr:hypothetical protein BCR35DRAFT_308830 [Leucosporidium creatinivorum]